MIEFAGKELLTYDLPADMYADGLGAVQNLGTNFRAIYFVFTRGMGGIIERVPVFCIVRPRSSILNPESEVAKRLAAEPDPRAHNGVRH